MDAMEFKILSGEEAVNAVKTAPGPFVQTYLPLETRLGKDSLINETVSLGLPPVLFPVSPLVVDIADDSEESDAELPTLDSYNHAFGNNSTGTSSLVSSEESSSELRNRNLINHNSSSNAPSYSKTAPLMKAIIFESRRDRREKKFLERGKKLNKSLNGFEAQLTKRATKGDKDRKRKFYFSARVTPEFKMAEPSKNGILLPSSPAMPEASKAVNRAVAPVQNHQNVVKRTNEAQQKFSKSTVALKVKLAQKRNILKDQQESSSTKFSKVVVKKDNTINANPPLPSKTFPKASTVAPFDIREILNKMNPEKEETSGKERNAKPFALPNGIKMQDIRGQPSKSKVAEQMSENNKKPNVYSSDKSSSVSMTTDILELDEVSENVMNPTPSPPINHVAMDDEDGEESEEDEIQNQPLELQTLSDDMPDKNPILEKEECRPKAAEPMSIAEIDPDALLLYSDDEEEEHFVYI